MKDTKENIIESCQKMQGYIAELKKIIEDYTNTCNTLINRVKALELENSELKSKACKCDTKEC
jgi:regulator of replication initiation timing